MAGGYAHSDLEREISGRVGGAVVGPSGGGIPTASGLGLGG
ncbi:hypothetical protein [Loktanella sp. Alg231-35]|nr:hypothetical protein [Loktanella sp. Alg231-35]